MRWKSKIVALFVGFSVGVVVVFTFNFLKSFFESKPKPQTNVQSKQKGFRFKSIDEIIASLKSEDVSVRHSIHKKLFVNPALLTNYYDYQRDSAYPERAENISWQSAQLDDGNAEAIIRFTRLENPVAIILRQDDCGWRVIAAFSAWLRFEDYPYTVWFGLRESTTRGVYEILLRDSTGDSVSYQRKARLLKLIEGRFQQVAEFEEESISSVENYQGEDWADVKILRQSTANFENPKRIEINTTEEIIKFEGKPKQQNYFSESDGAFHTMRSRWRTASFKRIKFIEENKYVLVWDENDKMFRREGQR